MKVLFLVLLTCTAVSVQVSDGLRKKYGSPVSETYLIRPGIVATVNYSKDGSPCSATIAAQTNPKFSKDPVNRMDNKVMRALVDELVPASQRGKLINSGFLNLTLLARDVIDSEKKISVNADSFYGTEEHYEKVTITIGGPSDEKKPPQFSGSVGRARDNGATPKRPIGSAAVASFASSPVRRRLNEIVAPGQLRRWVAL